MLMWSLRHVYVAQYDMHVMHGRRIAGHQALPCCMAHSPGGHFSQGHGRRHHEALIMHRPDRAHATANARAIPFPPAPADTTANASTKSVPRSCTGMPMPERLPVQPGRGPAADLHEDPAHQVADLGPLHRRLGQADGGCPALLLGHDARRCGVPVRRQHQAGASW